MIRAHRFALALIALVAAVIFLPALIKGEVFVVRDHLDYFQPLRWFTAMELKAGHLPLWNPYSASGEPWLANPQTGVFYPPTWLFLVLPFPAAYMSFLLLHLVILGWGAYLLFARTASQGAAMVGAVALMFCGPVLSLVDINNNLATFAWLPLVLWCAAEKAWRRGALALALAFLGGEPFFAAVGALMFVFRSAAAKPPLWERGSGGSAAALLKAALGAFGLTAIQLFPFLEAIRSSDRAARLTPELILRDSMPLQDWFAVALPWMKSSQHFIPVVYAGIVVVALALVGTTKREARGWLVLLAFAVVIGAGPSFLAKLPLTLFRYPARMVPLGALAIAALAVIGWERLRPKDRRWVDLILILVIAADLLSRAAILLPTAPFRRDLVPYKPVLGADRKFVTVGDVPPEQRTFAISGYLNLYDRRFDSNTAAPFESEHYRRLHLDALQSRDSRTMNFFSIGYVLSAKPLGGLESVARVGSVNAYRNPGAWPMAGLVTRSGIVAGQWTMDTKSATITVDAPQDGLVVLTQQYAPGWSVTVDGRPRPIVRAGGIFRGVNVAKGRRVIVWSYRPRALGAGAIVTIITALVIAISVVVKSRR